MVSSYKYMLLIVTFSRLWTISNTKILLYIQYKIFHSISCTIKKLWVKELNLWRQDLYKRERLCAKHFIITTLTSNTYTESFNASQNDIRSSITRSCLSFVSMTKATRFYANASTLFPRSSFTLVTFPRETSIATLPVITLL